MKSITLMSKKELREYQAKKEAEIKELTDFGMKQAELQDNERNELLKQIKELKEVLHKARTELANSTDWGTGADPRIELVKEIEQALKNMQE